MGQEAVSLGGAQRLLGAHVRIARRGSEPAPWARDFADERGAAQCTCLDAAPRSDKVREIKSPSDDVLKK